MSVDLLPAFPPGHVAWNKGRTVGQKHPLCRGMSGRSASGSKWRATPATSPCSTWRSTARIRSCDLVTLRVRDVFAAGQAKERASLVQNKMGESVRV